MLRATVSKVMWVGRATVFLIGLSVILAVVFGLASTAFGANGDAWRLGQGNVATKLTSLGGTLGVNGAMLKVANNNGGTDDTALRLQVDPQEPPMSVNSTTKVSGFNADQLDGKEAYQFMGSSTYRLGSGQERLGNLQSGGKVLSQSCLSGDRLLSGGPASVNAGSIVLDSFPTDTNTWQVRINDSAVSGGDSFTVVVLCADQP